MRKPLLSALLILIAVLVIALPAQVGRAQAPGVEIGQVFQGAITKDAPQVSFSFKGKPGEWALVEFLMNDTTFSRPPIFRIMLTDTELVNTAGVPAQTAEALVQLPKEEMYNVDVVAPPSEEEGSFSVRVVRPAMLNAGQPIQSKVNPLPTWFMMFSNGPFALLYTTADPAGLPPLTLSGLIPSGKPTPGGTLKLALNTDNTIGGDPDFGSFSNITVSYNPKPAVAAYLIRVGSSKGGTPPFTLLRTDAKK